MSRDYAASLVGRQFGDYRVEGVLGRGGMGAVLRGRDIKLDRDVALKIIGQEFGGQAGEAYDAAQDRFQREAKTLAGLTHPNLIHLYAVGEIEGKHYFAMELVHGPTLGEWISRFGPLRGEAAVRFTAQVLSALSTVHATGYVHRDIKPGNIMLDCAAHLAGRRDHGKPILEQLGGDEATTGRWVLMDFGLAKLSAEGVESSLTQQGLILGTPDTMSPEQAQGLETTRVSDLYSFGVVLFLALAGRLPFTAASAMGVMQKHLMEAPPSLANFWPQAPQAWCDAIAKLLEKAPERRFQAEWQVAAALAGRVEDLPELRELAKPPRTSGARAAMGATMAQRAAAAAAGVPPGTTAALNAAPDTSQAPVSARTVSPRKSDVSSTDATIRDLPAMAAVPSDAAATKGSAAKLDPSATAARADRDDRDGVGAKTGAGSSPAPLVNAKKTGARKTAAKGLPSATAAASRTGASTPGKEKKTKPAPAPQHRGVYIATGVGVALMLLLAGGLLWWYWPAAPAPTPPPPPVVLAPIPANAFWAEDPKHPGQKIAIRWEGLDPTTQQYLVEVYNAQTKAWDSESLTHDQMMQFGDLKKPASSDATFPRPKPAH